MTDKDQDNDNYELPSGVVLPQDDSPDYPNWKKGIVLGIIAGIFGAFVSWLIPMNKIPGANDSYTVLILAFVIFFLVVGSIAAFRPPMDNNTPKV